MPDVNQARVSEILRGGKTNELTTEGVMINDPDAVIVGEVNGKTSNLFGVVGSLDQGDIDYLFHRWMGVTMSEKEAWYEENDPSVYVYVLDSDNIEHAGIRRETYTWSKHREKWAAFSTATVQSQTDEIPEGVKWNSWKNFGDANPREHGGNFVKWEDGNWKFVSTREMGEQRQRDVGEKYMGMKYQMSPNDIWVDPMDLDRGLEDHIKSKFSVLGMSDVDPNEVEEIVIGLSQIAMEMNARDFYFSNYWKRMNRKGIYQSTVT